MAEIVAHETAAGRAEILSEWFVCANIAALELQLQSRAAWIAYYGSRGQADKEAYSRRRMTELVAEHAAVVAVYERRFGEVPRFLIDAVDTRRPGHWTLQHPKYFPPLPEVRRG